MSARIRRRLADESGFTLVELLVVIVILGILAAIAIPAYLGQRSKAQDGEAKVYTVTASKALAVWHSDHDTFDGADTAALEQIEPSLKRARNLTVSGLGQDAYTVSVDSRSGTDGGGTFTITRVRDGDTRRTCANPGAGSCLDTPEANGNLW